MTAQKAWTLWLDDAEDQRRNDGSGDAAQAAEYADRKNSADILAAEGRIHRLDDDEKPSGNSRGRNGDAEGQLFTATVSTAIRLRANSSWATAMIARPMNV